MYVRENKIQRESTRARETEIERERQREIARERKRERHRERTTKKERAVGEGACVCLRETEWISERKDETARKIREWQVR